MASLLEYLDTLTVPGELYEVVDETEKTVRCYACAHRCLIKDGRRGICQVRYNKGGVLRVPHGYVAALQVDPTEKKPFYHVLPGSQALSFGMLGCDLHCSYCFTGDTIVITDRGPIRLDDAFEMAERYESRPDGGNIAYPDNLRAAAASGKWRPVRTIFKHPYKGKLAVITPYYLPSLRCTADHQVYATDDVTHAPVPVQAQNLTTAHYLAVPRRYAFSTEQIVDVQQLLGEHEVAYRVSWKLSIEEREMIAMATEQGATSAEIGAALGKSASYIRHVRSKIAQGRADDERVRRPIIEQGKLRFPNEHRPGLPSILPLDTGLARLLGFYCAEGSVVSSKKRPNSHVLNFAFSPDETHHADEVKRLLKEKLGVEAQIVRRKTTLAVVTGKASVALLFRYLSGKGAAEKHVPQQIYDAPRPIVEAFLDAFVAGDGHRYTNGKVSITTVSPNLAYGVAWLALKLGYLPSLYDKPVTAHGHILGHDVNRAPHQYTIVWYEKPLKRRMVETEAYYLIPLRDVTLEDYEGDVYNMEVDIEHNYLAGFFLVKNCQNWDISQFGRDDRAGRDPLIVSEGELIRLARQRDAAVVASTYNEPLITTEWAVSIFKQAKAAGMKTVYVSNGNATPEVLDYLRPHLDAYKIDLKSMRDKPYRQLGTVLQHVLDTIEMVYKLGLWMEVVTLIVPGFNDSTEELWDAARFLAGISPDIPWHVTAFHPDYKMREPPRTTLDTLIRAAEIGSEAGLHYVYAGNVPGAVGEWENTRCPNCGTTLIRRYGFHVMENRLAKTGGKCPECGTPIPGIWTR